MSCHVQVIKKNKQDKTTDKLDSEIDNISTRHNISKLKPIINDPREKVGHYEIKFIFIFKKLIFS
jgi:hypothetical protein